jgi:hypothetical protein
MMFIIHTMLTMLIINMISIMLIMLIINYNKNIKLLFL